MSSTEYESPETFRPERFLNDDLDKPIKGHLVFGAGKSEFLNDRFAKPCVAKLNLVI